MLLMIFVIDAEGLSAIPQWIGHAGAQEDAMGMADIVLPCFLFIIGLSIPFALEARMRGAEPFPDVLKHILLRSAALILMGLFVVNMDNMNDQVMVITKPYWQLLLVIAVFLIWNQYQFTPFSASFPKLALQGTGAALLIFLAAIYKGPAESWMQIYWWGILGLLGWSYGLCAILFLLFGRRLLALCTACCLFLLLNINEFVGVFNFRLIISASNYFMVMLGVLSAVIYISCQAPSRKYHGLYTLLGMAAVLFAFGIISRPEWGVSKIRATPSWTAICGGISILLLLLFVFIADVRKWVAWAKPIRAAGTAALSCYFMLYFFYAVTSILGFYWPQWAMSGGLGLLKSLLVSLLVIQFTALAGSLKLKLSIGHL